MSYVVNDQEPPDLRRIRDLKVHCKGQSSPIFFLLAALGLRFWELAFSSCSKKGLLLVLAHWLLIAVASPVAELRLWVHELQ